MNLEEHNFTEFVMLLCKALTRQELDAQTRQLAGVLLGRAIGGGRSAERLEKLRQRWMLTREEFRQDIKRNVLQILGAQIDYSVRRTAATIIAQIAGIETLDKWTRLVPRLLEIAHAGHSDVNVLRAVLACFAFLGQECEEELQPHAGNILTMVTEGMNKENDDVRLQGIQCLYEILEAARANMQKAQERNIIMQIVCACCQYTSNEEIRTHGYMACERVCDLYYDLLGDFIKTVFDMSKNTIEHALKGRESEQVAQQAVEFWTTCAEKEDGIEQEQGTRQNRNFTLQACAGLAELYLQCLCRQPDDIEDDEWSLRKAAGASLEAVASVAKDSILGHIVPFVQENATSQDWRRQEAALCAFGIVMHGPQHATICGLVRQILPLIHNLMNSPNLHVKKTATWTFGRVCEVCPECATVTQEVIANVAQAINERNSIAHYACFAVSNLAKYCGLCASENPREPNPMRPFARDLIQGLMMRASHDTVDARTMAACFETINTLVQWTDDDQLVMIRELLPAIVKQLKEVVRSPDSPKKSNMMGSLFSSITSCVQRLGKKGISAELTREVMEATLDLLRDKNAVVYEEALFCLSAIVDAIEDKFWEYLSARPCQQVLANGLGMANTQIVQICVGTIGDVFRHCGAKLARNAQGVEQFTDHVVRQMLRLLPDADVDMEAKEHLIGALIDTVMGLGGAWGRYHGVALNNVALIGKQVPPADADPEIHQQMQELRTMVIEFYTVVLSVVTEAQPYADIVTVTQELCRVVVEDRNRSRDVLKNLFELISDVGEKNADFVQVQGKRRLQHLPLFQLAEQCEDQEIMQVAQEAFRAVGGGGSR